MIDYKISNTKGFRFIFVIFDKFSKDTWCIVLENKCGETITKQFSKISTTSTRSPLKLESERRSELYNSIFKNFLKAKDLQYFSRYTDNGPSMAKRIIRALRNSLKKPVFEKGNANWLS